MKTTTESVTKFVTPTTLPLERIEFCPKLSIVAWFIDQVRRDVFLTGVSVRLRNSKDEIKQEGMIGACDLLRWYKGHKQIVEDAIKSRVWD